MSVTLYYGAQDDGALRARAIAEFAREQGVDCGRLRYDDGGRPILRGAYVSATHTDGRQLLALSLLPVGVDMERSDRRIGRVPVANIAAWTQYEAYGKLLGTGVTKRLLRENLPEDLIFTFSFGQYTVSVAGKTDTITLVTGENRLKIR